MSVPKSVCECMCVYVCVCVCNGRMQHENGVRSATFYLLAANVFVCACLCKLGL